MDPLELGINGLWAGLFAVAMGILLTAPPRHLIGAFLCAVAGRLARDVLMGYGMPQNWATVIASIVIVLVAVSITRGHVVSPVVLVSSVLPLGAVVSVFNTIAGIMKVSSLEGDALTSASVALSADMGKAFIITLAIALGLGVGVAITRLLKRAGASESA